MKIKNLEQLPFIDVFLGTGQPLTLYQSQTIKVPIRSTLSKFGSWTVDSNGTIFPPFNGYALIQFGALVSVKNRIL